jgi:Domain of unknown function (DUF6894)
MTHVYFHCSNSKEVLVDRRGAAVDDLVEARDQAASVVRSLTMARNLEDWRSPGGTVQVFGRNIVRRGDGAKLCKLTYVVGSSLSAFQPIGHDAHAPAHCRTKLL